MDLSGYMFTPGVIEVESGKLVKFELVGDGLEHTFTIAAIHVHIPVPAGTKVQQVEFTVPAGTPAELRLVCELHELAGMVGTVRVK